MTDLRTIRVFIASPGDVKKERKSFPKVLKRLNDRNAYALGYSFEGVRWEEIVPGFGRPQELVNKLLPTCDVFVIVFGSRWGSPTGEHTSGTEEEFFYILKWIEKAGSPHLLVYF